MTVFINEQQTDVILENEKNLGDLLRAFENDCAENEATITGICINGNDIKAENLDQAFSMPLDDVATVSLSTVSLNDIKTAFSDIVIESQNAAAELEGLSVILQKGKDAQASRVITRFTSLFQNICRVVTLSSLFPDFFYKMTIESQSILEYLKNFEPILYELESAYSRKDTVLIGDLAEYEIAPKLQSIVSMINQLNGQ